MSAIAITVVAICALAGSTLLVFRARGAAARQSRGRAIVINAHDNSTLQSNGAVRSVQAAELYMPAAALEEIWSAMYLERLARTYWRFLSRVTAGLIRVHYTERERFVVAFFSPLKLLTFQAPEYEMDAQHGVVRWRIERGLLVARRGRDAGGHLQIDVRRLESEDPDRAHLHIEIEVANFYPAIASSLSRRLYDITQSRIHVIVTHAFLRSLARTDLAESRVGRFAAGAGESTQPPARPRARRLPSGR